MGAKRRKQIIDVFDTAFGELAQSAPAAFRVKYRKMAADPFAFYRGSACLFYADVTNREDEWVDDRSGRIWIHGDLHPENFGTYLNSTGRFVFDVNDYDEAYLGHYTWDLMRFAAGMALMGWQKALPEKDVRDLIGRFLRAYLSQVNHYLDSADDDDFSVNLDNTSGPVLEILREARLASRLDLLDSLTLIDDGVRRFQHDATVRHLGKAERRKVERAFENYLDTIPPAKRYDRSLFYEVRDIVGKSGFGIGSAGLPAYSVLVEGYSQSLDNDVVLSMKQANVPAVSYFAGSSAVSGYFDHEGHRTVVSQRSLQVHTDPLLGHTEIDGVGYVVSEVSPYELDLDWGEINEPSDMADVVDVLGQATAKIHCASDVDSDQDLVDFQTEDAIASVLQGRRRAFVSALTDFGVEYAAQVRADHAEFVEAFRGGEIGVAATSGKGSRAVSGRRNRVKLPVEGDATRPEGSQEMPSRKEDLPDTLERSPKKVQRTYEKALDSAHDEYDSEQRAHRTAWGAVKNVAEKKGDHWEPKDDTGPSDSRSKKSQREKQQGKGTTHGGVDVEGNSKAELMERAKKADIKGRSSMTKDELADALARKE